MRYVVPLSGSMVAPHFGHCEQFMLIDVDEEKREITKKEFISSPGHKCGFLPQWLTQKGVSVIIARGMGSRPQNLFQESNIKVVIGALENDPENAVLNYLNGKLTTGDNLCAHREGICDHHD
jgi:predicted Fe-Mo cluster-binding NifX family protein